MASRRSRDGYAPGATQSVGTESHRQPPAGVSLSELRGTLPGLELIELIGSGGMGAVFRARQTDLDRVVAVKVLPAHLSGDPRFVERFRREARAMAHLDHPNIVTVFGSGIENGRAYIVMEFIEGTNLRVAMQAGAIDAESALEIVPAICEGLAYAHHAGVVHRDIKPENVLLGTGGRVKIVDFGLAKWVDNAEIESSLTATGTRMGTVRYMAPEQFDGDEVDARADIYSLGVMFYEMLTGEVPMGSFRMPSETVGTDPRIDRVIDRTLQRRPADRYQSVGEVNEELSHLSEVEAIDPGFAFDNPDAVKALLKAQIAFPYFNYESEASILGLPVVSIAFGVDPQTGKQALAQGIIAIGDRAVGGIAVGGASMGVVAVGGAALGVNAIGGGALGLLTAIGGGAGSLGIAAGGGAIGTVGIGGGGVGVIVPTKFGGAGFASLQNIITQGPPANAVEASLQHYASLPEIPWVLDVAFVHAFLGPLLLVLFVALAGVLRSKQKRSDQLAATGRTPKRKAKSLNGMRLTTNKLPVGRLIGGLLPPIIICFVLCVTCIVLNHVFLPT